MTRSVRKYKRRKSTQNNYVRKRKNTMRRTRKNHVRKRKKTTYKRKNRTYKRKRYVGGMLGQIPVAAVDNDGYDSELETELEEIAAADGDTVKEAKQMADLDRRLKQLGPDDSPAEVRSAREYAAAADAATELGKSLSPRVAPPLLPTANDLGIRDDPAAAMDTGTSALVRRMGALMAKSGVAKNVTQQRASEIARLTSEAQAHPVVVPALDALAEGAAEPAHDGTLSTIKSPS